MELPILFIPATSAVDHLLSWSNTTCRERKGRSKSPPSANAHVNKMDLGPDIVYLYMQIQIPELINQKMQVNSHYLST